MEGGRGSACRGRIKGRCHSDGWKGREKEERLERCGNAGTVRDLKGIQDGESNGRRRVGEKRGGRREG